MIAEQLRRLALLMSLILVTVGGISSPSYAAEEIPNLADGIACEDGHPPDWENWVCDTRITFKVAPKSDFIFYATTRAGSATADRDYISLKSVVVTVRAGTTSQTINVRILDDSACERPETFTLVLHGGSLGSTTLSKEKTITDRDC